MTADKEAWRILTVEIIRSAERAGYERGLGEAEKVAEEYETGDFGTHRNMAAAMTASREIAERIRALKDKAFIPEDKP